MLVGCSYMDLRRITQPHTQFFKKKLKIWNRNVFETRAHKSYVRELKCNDSRVSEEYCRAITQAADNRAAADDVSVCWNLGFQLVSIVYTHILYCTCNQFRHAQNGLALGVSERNYCAICGMSMLGAPSRTQYILQQYKNKSYIPNGSSFVVANK